MITKDKLQKLTIRGQKDALKAAAKKEIADKKYDKKLLKKFKNWLEYMIIEIAKGGGRKVTLPLNPGRWDFKNLNASEEAAKFLKENNFDYKIDYPMITIKW